jgi:hypothetical protein
VVLAQGMMEARALPSDAKKPSVRMSPVRPVILLIIILLFSFFVVVPPFMEGSRHRDRAGFAPYVSGIGAIVHLIKITGFVEFEPSDWYSQYRAERVTLNRHPTMEGRRVSGRYLAGKRGKTHIPTMVEADLRIT